MLLQFAHQRTPKAPIQLHRMADQEFVLGEQDPQTHTTDQKAGQSSADLHLRSLSF